MGALWELETCQLACRVLGGPAVICEEGGISEVGGLISSGMTVEGDIIHRIAVTKTQRITI